MKGDNFDIMTRVSLELYYPISRGLHDFGKDKPEGYALLRNMNEVFNSPISGLIRLQLRDTFGE